MPYKDREAQRAAQAKHYQKNKDRYAAHFRAARNRRRDKIAELKSNPCTDCGNEYPYYVMQFDHTGTDKVASVAQLLTRASWQDILDEIAKCELVCANCHAERTHQRRMSGSSEGSTPFIRQRPGAPGRRVAESGVSET